jgi:uncharacterized protein YbcI
VHRAFGVTVLVAGDDREALGVPADRLVLGECHLEPLGAAGVGAFAKPLPLLENEVERLVEVVNALVHLSEDGVHTSRLSDGLGVLWRSGGDAHGSSLVGIGKPRGSPPAAVDGPRTQLRRTDRDTGDPCRGRAPNLPPFPPNRKGPIRWIGAGRGATVTRTAFQRNFIIAFLEDIYTPVEKTLLKDGQQEGVKQTRQLFQMAMRAEFSAAVEEITGRKVIQFMSHVAFDPDMAAEVFVLQPDGEDAVATD